MHREFSKNLGSMMSPSSHPGALSAGKPKGGCDTPYQPPVSLSLQSRRDKLSNNNKRAGGGSNVRDGDSNEGGGGGGGGGGGDDNNEKDVFVEGEEEGSSGRNNEDDRVSNTEYQSLVHRKKANGEDGTRNVHSSFSHLGRASSLMIDFFPALTPSNAISSSSLSTNQMSVNLVNHRGLTLRRPMCMMNQNEGQNMHNDLYQQHHHTRTIAHNPSLQLLNPNLLAELQWLGNSLSYNELVHQRSANTGLLTTSDVLSQQQQQQSSHGHGRNGRGGHEEEGGDDEESKDDFDTGWELMSIKEQPKGRDMKFKLGLLNIKTEYYPQYMV
jgi:hypothetical protein